jgi:hypothetical protein
MLNPQTWRKLPQQQRLAGGKHNNISRALINSSFDTALNFVPRIYPLTTLGETFEALLRCLRVGAGRRPVLLVVALCSLLLTSSQFL